MGGGAADVLRWGNLLRMGVLWTLCLVYSHIRYLLLLRRRLRAGSPPRRVQRGIEMFDLGLGSKPACIVTGASAGLGRATATSLAHLGFHVILAGRSLPRLELVRTEIEAQNPAASCQALELDLCSVPSILSFVRTVKQVFEGAQAPGTLQLLVNNAGVLAASKRLTPDGFDVTTTTNYLGPFILTHHLLPLLQLASPKSRVINLVSFTHFATLNSTQLNLSHLPNGCIPPQAPQTPSPKPYYPLAQIYETSKLLMTLYSYQLHRQYFLNPQNATNSKIPKSQNGLSNPTRVSILAVDPGAVNTNILREVPPWLVRVSRVVLGALGLLQEAEEGARVVVAACLMDLGASGKYCFGREGVFLESSWVSRDAELGRRVWSATEKVCGEVVGKYETVI